MSAFSPNPGRPDAQPSGFELKLTSEQLLLLEPTIQGATKCFSAHQRVDPDELAQEIRLRISRLRLPFAELRPSIIFAHGAWAAADLARARRRSGSAQIEDFDQLVSVAKRISSSEALHELNRTLPLGDKTALLRLARKRLSAEALTDPERQFLRRIRARLRGLPRVVAVLRTCGIVLGVLVAVTLVVAGFALGAQTRNDPRLVIRDSMERGVRQERVLDPRITHRSHEQGMHALELRGVQMLDAPGMREAEQRISHRSGAQDLRGFELRAIEPPDLRTRVVDLDHRVSHRCRELDIHSLDMTAMMDMCVAA